VGIDVELGLAAVDLTDFQNASDNVYWKYVSAPDGPMSGPLDN